MFVKIFDKDLEEFMSSLERNTYAKVLKTISLLREFGYHLRMPYSKSLGKNLFELRTRGDQEIRIFYSYHKSSAVLLHGFIKKTQKAPQKELKMAINKLKLLTSR